MWPKWVTAAAAAAATAPLDVCVVIGDARLDDVDVGGGDDDDEHRRFLISATIAMIEDFLIRRKAQNWISFIVQIIFFGFQIFRFEKKSFFFLSFFTLNFSNTFILFRN